ncbi:MAG TPA: FGGY family carbohydrate kinase [Dictyoglomaceae bacterium]|nr:FGGY family carbohydrate kinase [Dictyoglomaceae bacterium]
MYFITIDFGTTNFKIFLWDYNGKIILRRSFPTPILSDNTIDPFAILKIINDFFNSLERRYKKIEGISVTGMGEAGLLVDKKGNPLTPIFSWLSEKGSEELKILECEREKLFNITGLKILPKYSLAKILWLKKYEKELWEKSYKWLNAVDFINFYLTDKMVTDYTLASRMLLFDIKKKRWSKEILKSFDIPEEKLPQIQPLGTIIGEINPILSRKFSLPKFPIILGGHDHPVASLSLNLKNSLLDSWGTAEAYLIHTREPLLKEDIRKLGFSVGCIKDDLYYLIAGIPFSGGIKKWLKENMRWEILPKKKSSKVLFFPYLLGEKLSQKDVLIKGFFYGIDHNTTIDDLKTAVWEGVFYESRDIIENIKNLGVDMEKIILTGGMSRFKSLIELKANILNIPLYVSSEKELTSKGLAWTIVRAINPENIDDFQEKSFYIINPNSKKEYEEKFEEYKKIKDLLGI